MLKQCLNLAIEEETYEYTSMYQEFAAQARTDRDQWAEAAFQEQVDESKEHDGLFHTTAKNFGLLSPIEHHHAERYGVALKALEVGGKAGIADELMSDL
jgi:rubrerythrin